MTERGRRKTTLGVVTSDRMDKTIVVRSDVLKQHPRYKKYIRRSTKLHAHDESNECKLGDVVSIEQCRPLSKSKSWRLYKVLERAN